MKRKIRYSKMSNLDKIITKDINKDNRFEITSIKRYSDNARFCIGMEVPIEDAVLENSVNMPYFHPNRIRLVYKNEMHKIVSFKIIDGVIFAVFDRMGLFKQELRLLKKL